MRYVLKKIHIRKLIYAVIVILFLTFPRIYSTLEYNSDYPRLLNFASEETVSVDVTWYALFGPNQYVNTPIYKMWGWHEISAYIGFLTFAVLGKFDTRNSLEYTLAGSYYALEYRKYGFGKLFDFNRVNFERICQCHFKREHWLCA